jgi:hypothetical protein
MVIASSKQVSCTFRNSAGELESYDGTIRKLGIDIGVSGGGRIIWDVFAPSGAVVRGALAGNYAGGTAGASVGAGLAANALVGGSRRSVALQPVSLEGTSGVNLAVGVADLQLRYIPERRDRRR